MDTWKQKLPMQLTLSRMYVVPLIVACLWPRELAWNMTAAVLFIMASITDYYDGYFARKYNSVSNMGKFMDPVADKVLVTSVLTAMIPLGVVDPYMVIIIMIRDTLIGGLRAVAAADNVIIAAKAGGKWKTGMQMVAIPAAMLTSLPEPYGIIVKVGYGLLWVSVILSITSGVEYYLAYRSGHHNKG
jgi:CDP-diacylglycerol--glycerol-3-phosphate 3-phosphatidyltransferase